MLSLPQFSSLSLLDPLDDDFFVYPMNCLMPRSFNQGQCAQLATPSIKDNKYNIAMDMRHFDPSEISIKCENNSLQVSGKREKKSDDGHRYEYRQYVQHFTVPENVKADELKCQLDKRGFLQIEAPLKHPQVEENKERNIPIEFVKK